MASEPDAHPDTFNLAHAVDADDVVPSIEPNADLLDSVIPPTGATETENDDAIAERAESQVVLENLESEDHGSSLPQEALQAVKLRVQSFKQTAGQWGGKMLALLDKKQDAVVAEDVAPAPLPPPALLEEGTADGKASELGSTTGKFIAAAAERMTDFGRASKQNAAWVVQTAAEGIKRMTSPSHTLRTVCRQEASSRPVPQSVLLLCSAIAHASAGTHPLLGDHDAEAAALLHQLEEGKVLLLPPDVEPAVAFAALKHLLQTLAEPVLLTRLADQWIAAADDAAAAHALLPQLPIANLMTLRVVLQACRYATTVTTTHGEAPAPPLATAGGPASLAELATALAPVLLWRVTPTRRALDVPAALASVRSKISSAMVGVTAPSVATHDLGVIEERGTCEVTTGGTDVPSAADAQAVAHSGGGGGDAPQSPDEPAAVAAPTDAGFMAATPPPPTSGAGATAVHLPEVGAVLPPSVAIVSPSGAPGSHKTSAAGGPTSPGGRSSAVAPSDSEVAEEEGLEEEVGGGGADGGGAGSAGQHVLLTSDEVAAVASVLQLLLLDNAAVAQSLSTATSLPAISQEALVVASAPVEGGAAAATPEVAQG